MIGIFGGTFDPIHYGHLRSALEVKEIFGLNEVRFIPCAYPPHRDRPEVTAAMRLAMLSLAVEDRPGMSIDTRELDRFRTDSPAPSYMVDTLKSLRDDFSSEPLLLFIGSDAFEQLPRWHRWRHLFDFAHIVVMTRPGYEIQVLEDFFQARLTDDRRALSEQPAGKLFFQAVTQLAISATAIRTLIAEQHDPSFLLPDAVIDYIKRHRLYQSG